MRNFFGELKRRNVYRAAVAYGMAAWLLTQIATQVFPFFDIPNSAVRFVILVLMLGFPIAMLMAWLYEFTAKGLVREEDVDPGDELPDWEFDWNAAEEALKPVQEG